MFIAPIEMAQGPEPGKKPKATKPDGSLKTLVQNIVFGGTAGVVGQASVFPMYTAKTNMQNFPERYRGLLDCFRTIGKRDGVRALYTGLRPTLAFTFPEKAIKLAMNDYFRAHFANEKGEVSIPRAMAAGAGAGLCQVLVTNPMEMLMITMQTRQANRLPAINMMRLARELGFRRLYRDIPATLLRDIPFSVMFFPLNTHLVESFADEHRNTSTPRVLMAGCLAGSVAATLSTPMDVVKTRVMASTGSTISNNGTVGKPQAEASQVQRIGFVFRDVIQKQGVAGLFKGAGARILIISPLFGITTMFYEGQKKLRELGLM